MKYNSLERCATSKDKNYTLKQNSFNYPVNIF